MEKQRLLNTYVNNLCMKETIDEIEKMIACEKRVMSLQLMLMLL